MRTVLYAGLSTEDRSLAHQVTLAEDAGFRIDEVVDDHGSPDSGTKLADRPHGRLLLETLEAGDTLLVSWIDSLGSNYGDIGHAIKALIGRGVIVRTVIGDMIFDGATSDPTQRAVLDALIRFMATMAEAQAEALRERRLRGIEKAKALTDAGRKYRGRRPSFTRQQFSRVSEMLDMGEGPSAISRATGLTRQTILRIRADRAGADATLRTWAQ